MRYLAAYADNELMRLFNSAGSDKGSEVYWGEGGVPHLYALLYQPLLAPLWDQAAIDSVTIHRPNDSDVAVITKRSQ
jgi:hypothetical protein